MSPGYAHCLADVNDTDVRSVYYAKNVGVVVDAEN